MLKSIYKISILLAVLLMSGCGKQLIKKENKKVQAMLEINMPDYEHTTQNLANKIEDWMKNSSDYNNDKIEFNSSHEESVKGSGVVSCRVRGGELRVKFMLNAEVINGNLVKISMYKFHDLPSESDSTSDLAYVFYNKVKDQALEMTDRLEGYLNENTK